MKKILLLFAILFLGIRFYAQTFSMAKSISGSSDEMATCIATDDSLNIYVVGYFQSTITFVKAAGTITLTSAGSYDFFISKFDCAGNALWATKIGGAGNEKSPLAYGAVVFNKTNNTVIAGASIEGNATAYSLNGSNQALSANAGSRDAFIASYSTGGSLNWVNLYGSSGDDRVEALCLDPFGNIFARGEFESTVNFGSVSLSSAGTQDLYVLKLTASGGVIWAVKEGGTNQEASNNRIMCDRNGNIYVNGNTSSNTFTIGGYSITHVGPWGGYFIKYDSTGNVKWVTKGSNTGTSGGHGMVVDSLLNVYFISDFTGSVTYSDRSANTIAFTSTSGLYDVAIFKVDSNGNFIWGKRTSGTGNELAFNVEIDGRSNLYLNGAFDGNFGFGALTATSNGSSDAFILKLDSSGNGKTLKAFGGVGADQNNYITIDKSGLIFACGAYSGTANFGSNSLTSAGLGDGYFAKTRIDSSFTFLPGDTAFCVGSTYTIVPTIVSSSYLWSTTATTQTITVSNTGWYKLKVLYNCDYLIDSIFVSFSYCGKCPNGVPNTGLELVTNGDFTAGNAGFNASPYIYDPGHNPGNSLPGGSYDVINDASTIHFAYACIEHTNGSGKFMAINGSTTAGYVWQQTFNVKQNTVYSLSAWFNNLAEPVNYGGLAIACVHFRINGTAVSKTICINDYPDTWIQLDTFWNSGSNTSITLQIYNASTAGNGNDFGIDDISFRECSSCNVTANAGIDRSICSGDSVQLSATGGTSYLWSPSTGLSNPNIANPYAKPNVTTDYIVTVNNGGCTAQDTVRVNFAICTTTCFNCTSSNSINNGLVACYPFNGNAIDGTANGHNGTVVGATLTSDRFGNPNSAYNFNGVSNFISIPYSPAFNFSPTGSFSLCAWINPTIGNVGLEAVLIKSPNTGIGPWDYGLYLTGVYKAMTGYFGNNLLSSNTTIPANQWYFLTATYSDGDWKIYVNCQLDNSKINSGFKITQSTGGLAIGKKGDYNSEYFSGKIDDVRIYNRLLTVAEIQQMYSCNNFVTVTTSNDTTICSGSAKVLTTSGTTDHFLWSNGDTASSITVYPTATTKYWVRGQVGTTSCYASDTVTITTLPLPTIQTINDTTICIGSNITLTTSGNINRYLWSTGDTSSTITLTVTKDTVVWVRGQNGPVACFATDTVHITAAPFPVIQALNDTSICTGANLIITTTGTANRYLWSTGDTTASISITSTKDTVFWVRGQIGNMLCYSYDTVRVKVYPYYPVNLGNDTILCEGANYTLFAPAGVPRLWSNGDTSQSITITVVADTVNFLPQKYSVVTGYSNCLSYDTILIYAVSKPRISALLNGKTTICEGGSISLGVSRISPAAKINWSNGDTAKIITVSPLVTTTYFVSYVNNLCGAKDSITITVLAKPVITISPDDTICVGESTVLSVRGTSSYLWSNNGIDSDLTVSPKITTNYWVIGSNGSCTSDTQKVTVTVIPKPVAQFGASPLKGAVPLTVQFTNQSAYATHYLWDFGDGDNSTDISPNHIYLLTGTYTVLLIAYNDNGCSDTTSIEIIAQEKFLIYIPNAFSPDGDGINDLFEIYTQGVKTWEGHIYNRWGEELYTWKSPMGKGWDGKFLEQDVPDGIYIYTFNVKDNNNFRHVYKGIITLAR